MTVSTYRLQQKFNSYHLNQMDKKDAAQLKGTFSNTGKDNVNTLCLLIQKHLGIHFNEKEAATIEVKTLKKHPTIVGGLSYRQWQKRNSEVFNRLDVHQKDDLKRKGYKNVGWESVKKAYDLLQQPVNPHSNKLSNPPLQVVSVNKAPVVKDSHYYFAKYDSLVNGYEDYNENLASNLLEKATVLRNEEIMNQAA